jgi:uncharacterized protein (TIGR02246 family)
MDSRDTQKGMGELAGGVPPIEQLLIERACSRLVITYCTAADHHDVDAFLGIFADDARWHQADGSVFVGHAQIREYFVGRPRTPVRSHICSNILIEVLDAESARGTSMATVLRVGSAGEDGAPGRMAPHAVLEYEDQYERQPDGAWKIIVRQPRLIYSAV